MSTNAHVLQEFGSIPEHHHHCDDDDDHHDHDDDHHDGDRVDANVFCKNSGALLENCLKDLENISAKILVKKSANNYCENITRTLSGNIFLEIQPLTLN